MLLQAPLLHEVVFGVTAPGGEQIANTRAANILELGPAADNVYRDALIREDAWPPP
jgi:hypothetical protein